MINYQPFWETLKKKQITTYALIKDYKINSRIVDNMRNNRGITLKTLEKLCKALDCGMDEVVRFD